MTETSYGFIPYTREGGTLKFFLIHMYGSAGDMLWTFPKGKPEPGETPIETALREVKEETGLTFASYDESHTFPIEYSFTRDGEKVEKTTTYFLGEVVDTEFALQEDEVKEAGWFTLEKAINQLTFDEYKTLLTDAAAHLDKG